MPDQPSFRFDFDRIRLSDRAQFAADMQCAFTPPAAMSTADADRLLVRWMTHTITAWPADGYHWDDPAQYQSITQNSFMEGVRAFGAQFHQVFNPSAPAHRPRRKKHVHRAH